MKLSCVVDHIALQVAGAPRALIESKLLLAAQQFYSESRCFERACDALHVFPKVRYYEVDTGHYGFGIAGIEQVSIQGHPLIPTTLSNLDQWFAWEQQQGMPTHFFRQGSAELGMFPLPNMEEGECVVMQVRATLVPISIQAVIDSRDIEALIAGALSRLLVIKSGEWAHLGLADFYKSEFRDAIAMKSNLALKGDLNVPLQVAYRPLA